MTILLKASHNQLANVKNRFQGSAKKVLCLCSAGLLRSPTLANALHLNYDYNTRAAGVTLAYALIPVSEALLAWADEVVCVSKDVYRELEYSLENSGEDINNYNVHVLDIPDEYMWNDPHLEKMMLEQYETKVRNK